MSEKSNTKLHHVSKSMDIAQDPLKEYSILTNFPKFKNVQTNKEVLYCIPNEVILQSKYHLTPSILTLLTHIIKIN